MCLVAIRVKGVGEIKNIKWENSIDRYWYMVLEIKRTVIRVRKKQSKVSSCMNYLQFVSKGPENVRKTISFCWVPRRLSEILRKLSDSFSHTEYL